MTRRAATRGISARLDATALLFLRRLRRCFPRGVRRTGEAKPGVGRLAAPSVHACAEAARRAGSCSAAVLQPGAAAVGDGGRRGLQLNPRVAQPAAGYCEFRLLQRLRQGMPCTHQTHFPIPSRIPHSVLEQHFVHSTSPELPQNNNTMYSSCAQLIQPETNQQIYQSSIARMSPQRHRPAYQIFC